jgi:hypothetical protein
MKVTFNGKTHTVKQSPRGMLVSEEDNTFLGFSEDKLRDGCSVYVDTIAEVTEPRPDSSWLVADIKNWLDAQGVEYTSSMLKADLLALV